MEPEGSSGAGHQEEGSEVEPEVEGSATEGRPPLLTMTSRGEAIKPLNTRPVPPTSFLFFSFVLSLFFLYGLY